MMNDRKWWHHQYVPDKRIYMKPNNQLICLSNNLKVWDLTWSHVLVLDHH